MSTSGAVAPRVESGPGVQPPVTGSSVLFIGGFGRSGSTLLAYLLGGLPGFVTVGEVHSIWQAGLIENELCGCGEPFHRCPFWTAVGFNAFGGWASVDAEAMVDLRARTADDRAIPGLVARLRTGRGTELGATYLEKIAALYTAISRVSGECIVVDSSKLPADCIAAAASPGVNLRLAHLVRDSRGVAFSKAKPRVVDPGKTRGRYMASYPPRHTAVRWVYNTLLLDTLSACGIPRQIVRYEDLAAAPDRVVETVVAFSGANLDRREVGEVTSQPSAIPAQHSLRGNPSRFSTIQRIARDSAWETSMAARDKAVVSTVTAPLLWRFGYVGSRRRVVLDGR